MPSPWWLLLAWPVAAVAGGLVFARAIRLHQRDPPPRGDTRDTGGRP